ncbi:DHA2 family methylenomycin A resistance protein-like MFS transporter [Catenulispora sp. GAS73]|uniref:MFS transporter n=1 Tax=Catenulispora sp. GAS73 TaxID=3156269 RepID=UPI00351478A7
MPTVGNTQDVQRAQRAQDTDRTHDRSHTNNATPRTTSPNLTLFAALLGFVMIAVDTSAVNVGLPAVGRGLGGSTAGLQWIVDAYTLMFAALLLSAGAFSDRLGASRLYAGGAAAFTLASVACGLAPNLGFLIVARLVQGSAAALMLPSSLALVRQAFPDARARAAAIARWTMAGAAATAVGPILGGALTSSVSWRSIFFLNLPVGLVILAAMRRTERSVRRPAPLDLPGQITAILGLAALTYGVISGGASGFGRPQSWGSLLVALVSMSAFVAVERRTREPMLPLGLLRDRVVAVCLAVGFVINAAYQGLIFVFGLFAQDILGRSAVGAGLVFVPTAVLCTVTNLLSARAAGRWGARMPVLVGQLACAVGLLMLLVVNVHTSATALALLLLPLAGGLGFAVPSLTAMMLGGIAPERAGLAGGVLNSFRQTGGALAVAGFGALVAQHGGFVTGMHLSLLIAVALLAATTLATLALPKANR